MDVCLALSVYACAYLSVCLSAYVPGKKSTKFDGHEVHHELTFCVVTDIDRSTLREALRIFEGEGFIYFILSIFISQ